MASSVSSSHDAAIRDFRVMLRSCTVKSVCGRRYVLVSRLTDWMNSSQDSGKTQVERLLAAAYCNREQPALSVPEEHISSGDSCCLRVFSILLELGRGQLLDRFHRANIVDQKLPVDLVKLKENLRDQLGQMGTAQVDSLAVAFDQKQWAYCAHKFELHSGHDFNKNKIIPICIKEEINTKGGTATIWQVAVQEEFVGPQLRAAVADARFYEQDMGYCYRFALKRFEDGNKRLFENEKNAFLALRHHKGMVRYLANYGHREIRPLPQSRRHTDTVLGEVVDEEVTTTYNILLEYGEFDLDEFFAERLPPVLQTELEEFWRDLFEVADVVDGIHNLEVRSLGEVRRFYGWHADIKPDNILNVQGKFKLADPGFATFVARTDTEQRAIVLGGTETYGAPEHSTPNAVSRAIDIWSLGCVFSIAATWVVFGYAGIQQFGRVREKAISKIIENLSAQYSTGRQKLSAGDYFHDGVEVLQDVLLWHNVLRSAVRNTDTITSQVLDLVDKKMLRGGPEKRIPAMELCKELEQISARCKADSRITVPTSIMEALIEVNDEAPSKASDSTPSDATPQQGRSQVVSHERKVTKSKPFMKTTHRSEYLKQNLSDSRPSDGYSESYGYRGPPTEALPSHPPIAGELRIYSAAHQTSDLSGREDHVHQDVLNSRTPPHAIRPAPFGKPQKIQTVFQARAERKRQGGGSRISSLLSLAGWKEKKDYLLTKHFNNRDIFLLALFACSLMPQKFLVDNAETMADFWDEATFVLETLVMKAKGQDKDGMDLCFTGGPVTVYGRDNPSKFGKAMEDPDAQPVPDNKTDMREALGRIFAEYLRKVHLGHTPKYLTLIVLTDGIWAGLQNKYLVEKTITTFLNRLRENIGDLEHRPVSIQFIQFGRDPDATDRLWRLDNQLKYDDIPDIVDTEPSSGDVYKMLLGSFVEEFDERDEPNTPEEQPRSPQQQSPHQQHPQSQPLSPATPTTLRQVGSHGGASPSSSSPQHLAYAQSRNQYVSRSLSGRRPPTPQTLYQHGQQSQSDDHVYPPHQRHCSQ
ncbi:hypothetical protein GP486_000610 [Trichoglossum hirsutum]|uniref:non-specific serine/threonine protein kinase n=1 Tax=Trichoglossum hirsutum TaxID=265104 RepID=A0A9P8LIQ1_9PEZI|nr:hypothetical protein GP486_000610 [Trichoglossum hirsutum]